MTTSMILLQFLTLALVLAILLIVLVTLHKVRKVHISSFHLIRDLEITRKETKTLFSQIHALSALEKKLALPHPIPPVRGWVASPDFLLTVADFVLSRKPRQVVECSSGVSTLVAARCLQMNGEGHVYSLEHDLIYAKKTSQMIEEYGLGEWATILHASLISYENEMLWYDDRVLPSYIDAIELLVVDGPPHSTCPLARFPALPRLFPRLSSNAAIVLDDADREDEKEIILRWMNLAPDFNYQYLSHEKGCAIMDRRN